VLCCAWTCTRFPTCLYVHPLPSFALRPPISIPPDRAPHQPHLPCPCSPCCTAGLHLPLQRPAQRPVPAHRTAVQAALRRAPALGQGQWVGGMSTHGRRMYRVGAGWCQPHRGSRGEGANMVCLGMALCPLPSCPTPRVLPCPEAPPPWLLRCRLAGLPTPGASRVLGSSPTPGVTLGARCR